MIPLYIGALKALGAQKALVFCGPDGLDELGLAGPSQISELTADGSVRNYTIDPKAIFGGYAPITAIAGGTPEENAAITRRVLAGEKGAYRNAAVLNAAAAIVAGGKAATLVDGVKLAERSIDTGAAAAKLAALVNAASPKVDVMVPIA